MSQMTALAAVQYRRTDGKGWLTLMSEPDESRAQTFPWGVKVPNTFTLTDDDGNARTFGSVMEFMPVVQAETTGETRSIDKS